MGRRRHIALTEPQRLPYKPPDFHDRDHGRLRSPSSFAHRYPARTNAIAAEMTPWSGPINRASWCASAVTASVPAWRPRVGAGWWPPGAHADASGSAP